MKEGALAQNKVTHVDVHFIDCAISNAAPSRYRERQLSSMHIPRLRVGPRVGIPLLDSVIAYSCFCRKALSFIPILHRRFETFTSEDYAKPRAKPPIQLSDDFALGLEIDKLQVFHSGGKDLTIEV